MRLIPLLLLISCTAVQDVPTTFIMPTVETSAEERHVLTAHPVIPVYEDYLE